MKTKLLAMMLLAGGSMFAQTRVSVGIGFGGVGAGFYQPPPSYASNIPPCPGPDYTWVDGYSSQNHGRNTWVAGYWNRRPVVSRFNGDDHREGFARGFDRGQHFSAPERDFAKNRSFGKQDHDGDRNRFGNDRDGRR
jgi:hypothetical protein